MPNHEDQLTASALGNSLVAIAGYINMAPSLYDLQSHIIMLNARLGREQSAYHAKVLMKDIEKSKAEYRALLATTQPLPVVVDQLKSVLEVLQTLPNWAKEVK